MGLFSTLHCVGMCGGIMGALTYSLPDDASASPLRRRLYLALYNGGRLLSYALAGVVVGHLGSQLYRLVTPDYGFQLLQAVAALLMVGVGLYLGGWFPKFAYLERLGLPVWRRLEPIGRRLLPVSHPGQALLYGVIWGWLPCGLVYAALLFTLNAGGPAEGALFMLLFGIGTLPAIAGVALFTGKAVRFTRNPRVRRLAGLSLIVLALAGVIFAEQLHHLTPLTGRADLECIQ